MKVTFGLNLDGIDIRPKTPLIGEVTVGPKGLIGILATRLGLPAPITPEIHRVAEFTGILESHDNGERFYSKSIQIDGFNTAKTLLNWRDAWIQAGWNGKCSDTASQRIKDMVNVCADATESLSPGPADHFQEIITCLKQRKADLNVTCITDKAYLPAYLQDLMELINAEYSPLPERPQAPAKSDLGRLQRALIDGKAVNLAQDGSISYIESISQQSAATWISQHLGEKSFVIAENDTEPLDLALKYQGLPTLGASQQSTERAALQLVSYSLSLVWEPFDPELLWKFLASPVCPIPFHIRRHMLSAIASTPGIGGDAWGKSIKKVLAQVEEHPNIAKELKQTMETWVEPARFHQADGALIDVLIDRCKILRKWLSARIHSTDQDDLSDQYFATDQASQSMIESLELLKSKGLETLDRVQLDLHLEDALGQGSTNPFSYAEVGSTRLASHPAQIIEPIENLIWWSFQLPHMQGKLPWFPAEIEELAKQGCKLQTPYEANEYLASTWKRAFLAASERVILHTSCQQLDQIERHPLSSILETLLADGTPKIPTINADTEIFSGNLNNTSQVDPIPLPKRRRWWQLDGITLPRREVESYSSVNTMIKSPHEWVLDKHAKIKGGSLMTVYGERIVMGNVAHAVIQTYFDKEGKWKDRDPGKVDEWLTTAFPEILHKEGAILLQLGFSGKRESMYRQLVNGIQLLCKEFKNAEVDEVHSEYHIEGTFKGGAIGGYIDLFLRSKSGNEAIVDLKLAGLAGRKYEMVNNQHLQLCIYAKLRHAQTKSWPQVAFYIIEEHSILSDTDAFFKDITRCPPNQDGESLTTLWVSFEKTWAWRREQLDRGLIELAIEGTEIDTNSNPPGGGLKIDKANDRYSDYHALVGFGVEDSE